MTTNVAALVKKETPRRVKRERNEDAGASTDTGLAPASAEAAPAPNVCMFCKAVGKYPFALVPCGHDCCRDCAVSTAVCGIVTCGKPVVAEIPNVGKASLLGFTDADIPNDPLFRFRADIPYYVFFENVPDAPTLRFAFPTVIDQRRTTLVFLNAARRPEQETVRNVRFSYLDIQPKESWKDSGDSGSFVIVPTRFKQANGRTMVFNTYYCISWFRGIPMSIQEVSQPDSKKTITISSATDTLIFEFQSKHDLIIYNANDSK